MFSKSQLTALPESQRRRRPMRILERWSIFYLSLCAAAVRRAAQVMCCVTTQCPPLLSAAAITHSLMGSHQSQSARRYTAATPPLHRLLGSVGRSRNSGGDSESSVAQPHSHVCGFVSSACLLIREPRHGPRTRPRAPGPAGECRVNVAAVSGGPGCVHVWCQKQLIGFSLQWVQSAVSSDKESEHMTERRV